MVVLELDDAVDLDGADLLLLEDAVLDAVVVFDELVGFDAEVVFDELVGFDEEVVFDELVNFDALVDFDAVGLDLEPECDEEG